MNSKKFLRNPLFQGRQRFKEIQDREALNYALLEKNEFKQLSLVGSPGSFLKKLIAEQNHKNDRLTRGALLLLVFFVALLLVGKVIMANRLVEASGKLRDLDKKITELSTTNGELSESVRSGSSLTRLEETAKASGFVKGQKFAVVKANGSVALRLETPMTRQSNQ